MSSSYNVNGFNPDPQAWAADYLAQGWQPVRIPRRDGRPTKAPSDFGWNKRPYTKDDFIVDDNVGLKLGVVSRGLADADLDTPEAVAAAPHFLPETGLIGGHERRPRSHYFYQTIGDNGDIAPAVKPEQLTYTLQKVQTTVIEIRGDGQQTLVAPSTHPDGGVYQWDQFGPAARVSYAQLRRAVVLTAIAATLAKYWPSPGRHNTGLAIAGLLFSCGVDEADAARLVEVAATSDGHKRVADRMNCIRDTYRKGRNGDKIKGIPSLAEVFPEPVVASLKKWCTSIAPETREWGNGHTDGSGFVDDARDPQPEEARSEPEPASRYTLITRPYSEIEERETSWMWYPYLPAKHLVSVEGNPGEGKSWITLALCAAVSVGKFPLFFSDGRSMQAQEGRDLRAPANVLHINIEDDPEETLKKRLRLLGADVSRVIAIEGVKQELKNGDKVLLFTIDHIPALEAAIRRHAARLVVLDPVQAYLPRGSDMNKAESMRPLLNGLMQVARRTNCTILLVRHFGKRLTETAIYKAIGSIDFAACVRSVLLVALYPKDPKALSLFERGVIVHAKSNLAPRGVSLDFQLRYDEFRWVGPSHADATEFTGARDAKTDEERSALLDACEFLHEVLAQGALERSAILAQGERLGIKDRTLDRAAARLYVKKTFLRDNGGKIVGATWELAQG